MASTAFTVEYQTSVPPERMFKALIADAANHHPKLLPQIIQSIEHEGSIQTTTFTDGSHHKIKIESEDSQNLTCKHTVIHGEMLRDEREAFSTEWKFERSSDGGSIIKIKGESLTKEDASADHTEDKEQLMLLCKLAEEYLLSNPAICA